MCSTGLERKRVTATELDRAWCSAVVFFEHFSTLMYATVALARDGERRHQGAQAAAAPRLLPPRDRHQQRLTSLAESETYWCQRSSLCSTFCLATQAAASGVPTALGEPAEAASPPTSPPKGEGGVFQNEPSLTVVVTRGKSGPCGGVVGAVVAAASVAAATALRHRRRHQQPPCQCWRREFPSVVAPAVAAAVDAERSTMRGSVPGSADSPPPRRVHMACASGVGGTSEVTMAKVPAAGARRARMGSSPSPRPGHHKLPGHVENALELFQNILSSSVYFPSCAAPFFPLAQVGSLRGLVRCQGPKICVDRPGKETI